MKNRYENDEIFIIRYLDGDLAEAEKIDFKNKLAAEPGFSEKYEMLKKSYQGLKSADYSIPEDYINTKIYQLHNREKSKLNRWGFAVRYSIVFSIFAMAFLLYYSLSDNSFITDDDSNYSYYQNNDFYNDFDFYSSINSEGIDDEIFSKLLSVDNQSIEMFYRVVNPYKDEFEYLSNEDIDYIVASLENKKF